MNKNPRKLNKVLVGISLVWAITFTITAELGIVLLPWLHGDDWGIGHMLTFVSAIIGFVVSAVTAYFSIRLIKKNPSSKFGMVFLYLNLLAVLSSFFIVPFLLIFETYFSF